MSDVSQWEGSEEEEQQHSCQTKLCYMSSVFKQEERRRQAIAKSVVSYKSNFCDQVKLVLKRMIGYAFVYLSLLS
jgi:hypothetical protein